MQGSYDYRAVVLSFLIAWFAAFVAIQLVGRVRGATTRQATTWIWAGGIAFGLGIWSMHFMGMLAFRLPVPMLYDVHMTALSVLPAVLSSVLALYVAGRLRRSFAQLLLSAMFMGLGICAMHYLGMNAITFTPSETYSPFWVVASVVVAIAVSLVALHLLTRFSWVESEPRFGVQIAASALMALGVCGMHYTGMAALQVGPDTFCLTRAGAVPGEQLSLVIVSIALLYLAAITIGSQRDLHASEQRFRALVDGAPNAMVIFGPDERISLANVEAERMLGYGRGGLVGKSVDELLPERVVPRDPEARERFLMVPRQIQLGGGRDLHCRRRDGVEIPIAVGLSPLTVLGRRVVIASIMDLTERKEAQARIERLAYFDALTGLPNRSSFENRLAEMLGESGGDGFGLIFADLDGFKEINDSLGHSAGDRVLTQIAHRLREGVGERGEVFRFGGDEFIILLPDGSPTRDAGIAEELIRRIAVPIWMESKQLGVTLSLGSVRHPEHGREMDGLVKRADIALYQAKSAGKNVHLCFRADMEESVTRRFTLLNDLRSAQELGQLALLYQPIIELRTRRIIGAEALVYWNHPQHGRITPATFIPVAEEHGLIESLGEWVLEEAVRQSAGWRARGLPPLRLAVNVSCAQFRDANRLRNAVDRVLRRHGYPADGLELEITERQIMRDPESSIATMKALSELGVAMSLDDFGTGYSSLGHLRDFPLRKLKIDQSFTEQIDRDAPGRAIVRAVVELGRNLGMQVVAEGVEREAQMGPLLASECAQAQGFLFGAPMPAAEFERRLLRPMTV
ncbi:EAL domain-containing protein [Lysobacter sp. LF1]|uniref:EAL domain-containing protein n=1 Tax=Lysobacter stagni TaxID=3045172 RepID=A0ABT6XAZ3_9GAMM|nr:EAL domain-containing protein [Lysobacter sp. LF1]MDI9237311.1 EAL domain-containing protein [Lysobacter sp. LF1]